MRGSGSESCVGVPIADCGGVSPGISTVSMLAVSGASTVVSSTFAPRFCDATQLRVRSPLATRLLGPIFGLGLVEATLGLVEELLGESVLHLCK